MPDYKKMYLTMVDAAEKAMELLIAAQQACEELYVSDAPSESDKIHPQNSESGS